MLLNQIEKKFKNQQEFKRRDIIVGSKKVTILHIEGLSNSDKVNLTVMQPLMLINDTPTKIEDLNNYFIYGVNTVVRYTSSECVSDLLKGNTLVFLEKQYNVLSVDTEGVQERSITEPPTSNVTKGPRQGFIESIKTNISLLRRRLKTPDFKIINLSVGKYTDTSIAICYIDTIADKKIVKEIETKIKSIDIDGIIDSSYIARYLDGGKTTFFKTVGNSEKPDIVTAKMLEGRIAIIVDGSPMVLTLPYMFIEDLQSPEDYYEVPQTATMARILRLISVIGSIILPSVFVSLQLFNYQIIPTKFLITILNATQGIPFSPLVEMIIVLVLFDILREANSRMPRIGGLALSVVGAIVLGDAAVRAGLLGAPSVMIGALSGIGLYSMPDNTMIFTLLRLVFTIVGGIMGIFGLILVGFVVMIFMVSLNFYKTPYLAPYSPSISSDKKDGLIKFNLLMMKKRPKSISNDNLIRQRNDKEEGA